MILRFRSITRTVAVSSPPRPRARARSRSATWASKRTSPGYADALRSTGAGPEITTGGVEMVPRRTISHAAPPDSSASTTDAAASCGTVKAKRRAGGRTVDREASPIRVAMAGQRSTVGGRSSSARALVTTRRSSSSVVRHASHEATCASSVVRSGPESSPSRYSESRSVHWSFIVPAPSALEMLAERHTGMMQLRFRRAGHDPQHVGDLLVPVPLDIVQHEHLPGAVGQPPDGLLEVHRQLRRRRAPGHPVEDVGRVVIAAALCAEGGAPGEDDVYRQAVQPRPERRFAR